MPPRERLVSVLTVAQLAYDWAGWRGNHLPVAVAIGCAETDRRPELLGDLALVDDKWGPSANLWQIRSLKADLGRGTFRDLNALRRLEPDRTMGMACLIFGARAAYWVYEQPPYPRSFRSKFSTHDNLGPSGVPIYREPRYWEPALAACRALGVPHTSPPVF